MAQTAKGQAVDSAARPLTTKPVSGSSTSMRGTMLQLQAGAGNRAVAGLVAQRAHGRQGCRQPIDAPTISSSGRQPGARSMVQRHSSWEHKLLGDADPKTLAQMGSWQDLIDQTGKKGKGGMEVMGRVKIGGVPEAVTKGQVMHLLVQEMSRLKLWQTNPPTRASTDDTMKITEKDPVFDVVIVRLPAAPGQESMLITYGELNTLADFYGDLETMKRANPKQRRQLVQSVRKETFLRLKEIYDALNTSLTKLEQKNDAVTSAQQGFKDGKLSKASFSGAAKPDFISGIAGQADLLAGDKPLLGQGTGARGDTSKYGAGLARNACHFVPESWHSWAATHDSGRALAQQSWDLFVEAKRLQDAFNLADYSRRPLDRVEAESAIRLKKGKSAALANEALLSNGFGDHYLQDSYASGHMINKTQIMQWYVQYIDKSDEWDYFKDKNWRKVQQMAYGQNLADAGQYDKANVKGASAGNQNEAAARNPQSVESGVAGDWKARFDALGLAVPASLRTPDSIARRLMEWWQVGVMDSVRSRELTGAEFGGAPVAGQWLEKALKQLIRDGVVRTDEDLNVRGRYMGLTDEQLEGKRFTHFGTRPFVLRDDYIPKGKEKKAAFRQALKATKRGDDSSYQKMAASVTYGDYLEFMKSGFIQKSTNALHDTFCAAGLTVSSSAGGEVFKVYGDDRMLNSQSAKGVEHAGVTANMSRDSIISIINSGTDGGKSAASILGRLPSQVRFDVKGADGAVVSTENTDIATWHNSAQKGYLHDFCDTTVFPGMSWSLMQKMVPGAAGSDLGKISKDEGLHGADAF